jgi:hypothetical protein
VRLDNGEFAAQQYIVGPNARWLFNGCNLTVGKISRVDGFAFGALDFANRDVEHCLAKYHQTENRFEILPVKSVFSNEVRHLIIGKSFVMMEDTVEKKVWGISTDGTLSVYSNERTLGRLVLHEYKTKEEDVENKILAQRFKGYENRETRHLTINDFKP